MRFVAVDSETDLISPGIIAPPLVCVSVAERIDGVIGLALFDHLQGLDVVESLLRDKNVTLIFHNGPYDLAVFARERPWLLPLIFAALAAGRIADTQIREQLIMIKRGDMTFDNVKIEKAPTFDEAGDIVEAEDDDDGDDTGESAGWKRVKKQYTLAGLVAHYLRKKMDKGEDDDDGGPRLTFGPYRGRIHELPERHRKYATDDAGDTLCVFEAQSPVESGGRPNLARFVSPDERMQAGAGFALHLCAVHGVRTDADALDDLQTKLEELQARLGEKLQRRQLVRPKKTKGVIKLSRNMTLIKQLVSASFKARGLPCPMTNPSKRYPEGQVSTSKDTVEAAASFDYPKGCKAEDRSRWLSGLPITIDKQEIPGITNAAYDLAVANNAAAALEPLVAFANTQKILGTYVKPMWLGVTMPMNSRPNCLVETGRTSWGAMVLTVDDGT